MAGLPSLLRSTGATSLRGLLGGRLRTKRVLEAFNANTAFGVSRRASLRRPRDTGLTSTSRARPAVDRSASAFIDPDCLPDTAVVYLVEDHSYAGVGHLHTCVVATFVRTISITIRESNLRSENVYCFAPNLLNPHVFKAFIDNDFPEHLSLYLPSVLMMMEESSHYGISGLDSRAEWATTATYEFGYLRFTLLRRRHEQEDR